MEENNVGKTPETGSAAKGKNVRKNTVPEPGVSRTEVKKVVPVKVSSVNGDSKPTAPAVNGKPETKKSPESKVAAAEVKSSNGEWLSGLSRPVKNLINICLVVMLMVFSVLIYKNMTQIGTQVDAGKGQGTVGTLNGTPIKASEISTAPASTITAEQVMDYARKQLVVQAMDTAKIPAVTDAELEKNKADYIGTSDWASMAAQQNMTEAKVKDEVRFLVRLTSYKDKTLGVSAKSLVAPTAPSKPTTETTAAYNKAMTEYQTKTSEMDAKWKVKLNEIFANGQLTIFSLLVL